MDALLMVALGLLLIACALLLPALMASWSGLVIPAAAFFLLSVLRQRFLASSSLGLRAEFIEGASVAWTDVSSTPEEPVAAAGPAQPLVSPEDNALVLGLDSGDPAFLSGDTDEPEASAAAGLHRTASSSSSSSGSGSGSTSGSSGSGSISSSSGGDAELAPATRMSRFMRPTASSLVRSESGLERKRSVKAQKAAQFAKQPKAAQELAWKRRVSHEECAEVTVNMRSLYASPAGSCGAMSRLGQHKLSRRSPVTRTLTMLVPAP